MFHYSSVFLFYAVFFIVTHIFRNFFLIFQTKYKKINAALFFRKTKPPLQVHPKNQLVMRVSLYYSSVFVSSSRHTLGLSGKMIIPKPLIPTIFYNNASPPSCCLKSISSLYRGSSAYRLISVPSFAWNMLMASFNAEIITPHSFVLASS